MDAIKKKMQAMKVEKDNAMDRSDVCEQAAKDAKVTFLPFYASPVFPSRPFRGAFEEKRPSNARIIVILPVFLQPGTRSKRWLGLWKVQ